MYSTLWNALPKPTWLRVTCCAVLFALVFLILMTVVFPYFESFFPWMEVQVG